MKLFAIVVFINVDEHVFKIYIIEIFIMDII